MTFLLPEDDDGAALEAALALLDSDSSSSSSPALSPGTLLSDFGGELHLDELFASPPTTPSALTTNIVISSSSTSTTNSSSSADNSPVPKKTPASAVRRRAASAAVATAPGPRVRKRNKTEILLLREQILQLTARLEQLQLTVHSRQSGVEASSAVATRPTAKRLPLLDAKGCVMVLEDAAAELRKLQAAEALNAKLRVEWRKQGKLAEKLEVAFKKHIMLLVRARMFCGWYAVALTSALPSVQDFDELLDPKLTRPPPALRTVQSSAKREPVTFVNLVEYLEALYRDTASFAASFNQSNTGRVFTDSRIYHDERLGQTLEFVMNAPLAGRTGEIDDYLWSVLAHDKTVDHAEIMNAVRWVQVVVGILEDNRIAQCLNTRCCVYAEEAWENACVGEPLLVRSGMPVRDDPHRRRVWRAQIHGRAPAHDRVRIDDGACRERSPVPRGGVARVRRAAHAVGPSARRATPDVLPDPLRDAERVERDVLAVDSVLLPGVRGAGAVREDAS